MKERTFKFGDNWKKYSQKLNKEMYLKARDSVKDIAGDIRGKTFLDIGCGSGIFSIAANSLGARRVLGIDLDPVSIETAEKNIKTILAWDTSVNKDTIVFEERSILDDCSYLGQFDIVYSWGVLHHTGNMYEALENAAKHVEMGGKLIISIYNKHFTSVFWKKMKKFYNLSPTGIKDFLFLCTYIVKGAGVCLTQGKNPFRKLRGMDFYYDVRDWIGGYPYEYASISEITDFFEKIRFKILEIRETKGFTGCNEFILEKETQCAE